jgi:hypothetical protein
MSPITYSIQGVPVIYYDIQRKNLEQNNGNTTFITSNTAMMEKLF